MKRPMKRQPPRPLAQWCAAVSLTLAALGGFGPALHAQTADAYTWQQRLGSVGAAAGQFRQPRGVAVTSQGEILLGDDLNNRVQVFDAQGQYLRQWTPTDGQGEGYIPRGMAIDRRDGSVYVVDWGGHRVLRFDGSGRFSGAIGTLGSGPGQLHYPEGVAVDSQGQVYVADTLNLRVQVFSPQGEYLRGWGGSGTGPGQFGAPPLNSAYGYAFPGPVAIAIDAADRVYVSDPINARVQKFDAQGRFLRAWGTAGAGSGQFGAVQQDVADGAPVGPSGLAVDRSGHVYVADSGNTRVQKFDPNGRWVASWGSAGDGAGQFRSLMTELAVDDACRVVTTDRALDGGARVQLFVNSTPRCGQAVLDADFVLYVPAISDGQNLWWASLRHTGEGLRFELLNHGLNRAQASSGSEAARIRPATLASTAAGWDLVLPEVLWSGPNGESQRLSGRLRLLPQANAQGRLVWEVVDAAAR